MEERPWEQEHISSLEHLLEQLVLHIYKPNEDDPFGDEQDLGRPGMGRRHLQAINVEIGLGYREAKGVQTCEIGSSDKGQRGVKEVVCIPGRSNFDDLKSEADMFDGNRVSTKLGNADPTRPELSLTKKSANLKGKQAAVQLQERGIEQTVSGRKVGLSMSLKFSLHTFFLQFGILPPSASSSSTSLRCNLRHLRTVPPSTSRCTSAATPPASPLVQKSNGELLVVIGGGAAGVYGAIRAKSIAPHLKVVVLEKGKLLSKVKISGGGRCNVTNGHCPDNTILAEHYPRGHRELRGSFFFTHGPGDTMSWFSDHGVPLKIEEDGRVFPVTNNSSSIVDCLLSEARERGVCLQTGKTVTTASSVAQGKFLVKVEKRTVDFLEYLEADYLMIASGSSRQGYDIAVQLGHSIIDGVPSLFTFKIKDPLLSELSGVTFLKVEATLKLESDRKNIPHLTQVGPMLVTHWGLSGPVILRLSAWGARDLFKAGYKALLMVDFVPDLHIEDMKSLLNQQKQKFGKQKLINSCPSEFGIVKRFWKYILDREGLNCDTLWASISNNSLNVVAYVLKNCTFEVVGKGQFKDEFVTAGGVPLSEISLKTMESKICPNLFFAGEVLNVDGVTGGFNFQNAWSGGYIAGTTIGEVAAKAD